MSENSRVVLIMATRLEALPFIEKIPLKQVQSKPFEVFEGDQLDLVISGVGKVKAAMATAYACMTRSVGTLVNLGAAGAAKPGFKAGEWYRVSKATEHDRISLKTRARPEFTLEIPGGEPEIVLATGENPVLSEKERERISEFADLIDMEGAAVIQAAIKFGTSCVMYKFVSDTVDHTDNADIVGNIKIYRNRFFEEIMPELRNRLQQEYQKE